MAANYTFNNFRFDRSEKDDGFSSTGTSLFAGTTSSFSMSPLLTLTPTINLAPQNNLANSYRANQSPNITISSTTQPKLDAVMALVNMKPQDALNGSNNISASKKAEVDSTKTNGTIQAAKQQLAGLDLKSAATNTTMMMPPPSPVITIGGGPSLFTSTSTRSKDKDRTPMYVTSSTPDPTVNAVNFTATPASAVIAARNNPNGGGLRPQTTSGQPLLSAANTTSDFLRDLKLTNLDKKMGEMGQRNFAIATAARNTLIDAGLRSPTAAPVAMVLKPDTPASKPVFSV